MRESIRKLCVWFAFALALSTGTCCADEDVASEQIDTSGRAIDGKSPQTQNDASSGSDSADPNPDGVSDLSAQNGSSIDAGDTTIELPLSDEGMVDTSGGAWRLIEVPTITTRPSVVSAPIGWLSLSSRALGYAKAPSGWINVLYRSEDGVHWELVPLGSAYNDLELRDLAYGAGRYVMLGEHYGVGGVIWSSDDGLDWTETEQETDYVDRWRRVLFAGGLFFGLGSSLLGVSEDGKSWTRALMTLPQPMDVAFGNGRYVIVGSGPIEVSEDGLTWQDVDLDCALPGACGTDPSGGIFPAPKFHVLFGEGSFYSDQLTSVDGLEWQSLPGRYPHAYVSGIFLSTGYELLARDGYDLNAWTNSGHDQTISVVRPVEASVTLEGRGISSIGLLSDPQSAPEHVDVSFEDGLTCTTATCVIVDDRLYLVPPPGTPELSDRTPRLADGTPLLTDDCPVSSKVFCEDYAARTGCRCDPEAPSDPESCDDVSHYACEGSFTPRDSEWQVDEEAQAGCSCDAVDPNQPLTFGSHCESDPSICQAPLQCLAVEPPDWAVDFPMPQRFICTASCNSDDDCPSWEATGFCSGLVTLLCINGSCQPRSC